MKAAAAIVLQCSPLTLASSTQLATGGRAGLRPTARRQGSVKHRVWVQAKVAGGKCGSGSEQGDCSGAHAGSGADDSEQAEQQQQQQARDAGWRQDEFAEGASVYDASKHSNCRGYGIVQGAAPPGHDGQSRWHVSFERGGRTTAIAESSLSLSHYHHNARLNPLAPQQRIVVNVGPRKGTEGATVAKCGDKWTCQLDGADRKESFLAERLHALEEPDWDTAYDEVQPQRVEEEVVLSEVDDWVHGYNSNLDKPVRLIRRHPDSHLWFMVLTRQRSIESLTDCEVEGLKYLLKEPGDVASMRDRLRKKAEGSWSISFKCARAPKCGCPFELQLRHASGSDSVEVWEMEAHQGHEPDSAAERAQLKMDAGVQQLVEALLEGGVKPYKVWCNIALRQVRMGGGISCLAEASDARFNITLQQVYAVRKQMTRAAGYGLTSDPVAVAAQAAELAKLGFLRFYQPLKERCDGSGSASDGQPVVTIWREDGLHQPLIIIVQTPFQQRMLAQFGSRIVGEDSTGGTNKYGYPTTMLTVQDECGRGVPAGFMISSSDTVEVNEKFLRALQAGARQGGAPEFKYGYIMIDKSKQLMAAVRQLVLTGDAKTFLLCYFHFLQEWERFVRSSDSGVIGKPMQHRALQDLAALAHMPDKALFEHKLEAFYTAWAAFPKVVDNMKKNWAGCAQHWAWWGRTEVLDLEYQTNNLTERGWGLFKWYHLDRNTQSTIQKLVDVLVGVWVPATMKQRQLQLAGRASNDQRRRVQRVDEIVAEIVASGAVTGQDVAGIPGLTSVKKLGGRGDAKACLSDLSCTCRFSADAVCVHLRAAAEVVGFTPRLRAAAADYLVERDLIRIDVATGVCSCTTLADLLKPVIFRPQDGSCTCHDHAMHGTCCHLLAAERLPPFEGLVVLTGEAGTADSNDQRINISRHRTFQQPTSEPLGDDWGKSELAELVAVPGQTAGAIRQAQSNADPAIAELRNDAAFVQRAYAALPDGEHRQRLKQGLADLRSEAAAMVSAAQLPRTAARAGKMARRQEHRPEGQRKHTALFPSRQHIKKRSLVQQQPGESGDDFKPLGKKGRASDKTRGITIPGNIDGTTQRTGPHRRYSRSGGSRQQATAAAGQ